MAGLKPNNNEATHQKLKEFLAKWTLEKVRKMTLEEYSDVGDKETFCYWLEFETEELGRIGGKPSNKFGIWKRKSVKQIVSEDFLFDGVYAWYKKYGSNALQAFKSVKEHVINIIENSQAGNFKNIDGIDLDSLAKWKIAFVYSNYALMPIYKNEVIRKIARHFEHPNYEKARLSELHTFILKQKPKEDDFFDWSWKQFDLAEKKFQETITYLVQSMRTIMVTIKLALWNTC